MNNLLLEHARAVAALIGTRVRLRIPSILAEGEEFSADFSVTDANALPCDRGGLRLVFEGSQGIAGLPAEMTVAPGVASGSIGGLRAEGSGVALLRAAVNPPAPAGRPAAIASNPAWVSPSPEYRLYFGDLHVHTLYSDCSGWRCLDPEWCYAYARDFGLLDFAAAADHLRGIAADPGRWPRLRELARTRNQPGRFVTFLAFESSHARGFGGDNNVYYLDDDADHFWKDDEGMRGYSPKVHLRELWDWLDARGRPYCTIPHHTGRAGKYRSWDEPYYDPAREPLFEIYSSWGSSEMRHSRFAISGGNNDAPAYFTDALKAGARFGVIASSDDHATLPGSVHQFRIDPFSQPILKGFAHKGLAAIRAPSLDRAALFKAMYRRETYATTHARSLLDFKIGDASMGSAVEADGDLRVRRVIRIRFTLDDAAAARIVLMRNGEEYASRSVRGAELKTALNEVVFEDSDDLDAIALRNARYHAAPFVVYYVRIEDGSGSHQWTSPIWIDLP